MPFPSVPKVECCYSYSYVLTNEALQLDSKMNCLTLLDGIVQKLVAHAMRPLCDLLLAAAAKFLLGLLLLFEPLAFQLVKVCT